jgi:hypothetical protein
MLVLRLSTQDSGILYAFNSTVDGKKRSIPLRGNMVSFDGSIQTQVLCSDLYILADLRCPSALKHSVNPPDTNVSHTVATFFTKIYSMTAHGEIPTYSQKPMMNLGNASKETCWTKARLVTQTLTKWFFSEGYCNHVGDELQSLFPPPEPVQPSKPTRPVRGTGPKRSNCRLGRQVTLPSQGAVTAVRVSGTRTSRRKHRALYEKQNHLPNSIRGNNNLTIIGKRQVPFAMCTSFLHA